MKWRNKTPTAIHVGSITVLGLAALATGLNEGLGAAVVFIAGACLAGMIGFNLGLTVGVRGNLKVARGDLTWLHFVAGVVMLVGLVMVILGPLQMGVLIALIAVVIGWLAEAR